MFTDICSLEQLVRSYKRARIGKRENMSVCAFDFDLESNIERLHYLLKSGKYIPSPYTHFTVNEPKTRSISAPAFRDRIVHHSLIKSIEPLFEKKFIIDSYACRKKKGTHFGAKRVKKFLMAARCIYGKDQPLYVLHCDVQRYYQSINWDVLFSIITNTITCPQTCDLIKKIIEHHDSIERKPQNTNAQLGLFSPSSHITPSTVSVAQRKGLPIGNLTSQIFANIYLNELDQYVKKALHEKWYTRYMDDFLIIHTDKEHLKKVREDIRIFLRENLKLTLHPKKIAIKNVTQGVTFVGYRIFYDHTLIKGETLIRLQRKYRGRRKQFSQRKITKSQMKMSNASVRGHLKHADTHNLWANLCNKRI